MQLAVAAALRWRLRSAGNAGVRGTPGSSRTVPEEQSNSNSALIVVDLQTGTTSAVMAHPIADVVSRSSALAEAFRAAGPPTRRERRPGRLSRSRSFPGSSGSRLISRSRVAL